MAMADYRQCDICGCKAFYDAHLNYQWETKSEPIPKDEQISGSPGMKLDYLGDWAVLCTDCAKTHECVIEAKQAKVAPQEDCPQCLGSGRMVRDADIGTDQECFACDATGKVDGDAPQAQPPTDADRLDAARNAALEEAATECEREMMFPGGRQESFAHHGVNAAAAAIRALKAK